MLSEIASRHREHAKALRLQACTPRPRSRQKSKDSSVSYIYISSCSSLPYCPRAAQFFGRAAVTRMRRDPPGGARSSWPVSASEIGRDPGQNGRGRPQSTGPPLPTSMAPPKIAQWIRPQRDRPRSRPSCHETPMPRTMPATSRPRWRSRSGRQGTSVNWRSVAMTANLPLVSVRVWR